MEAILKDIRYAVRRLRKSPGFTLVAALTLALGIGANSAIFSVVNAVLLRPLPFPEAERLDRVQSTHVRFGAIPSSGPDFLQMQAENRSYQALAAYADDSPSLTGVDEPVRLAGTDVSAGFFEVLGVAPLLGRTFAADENEPGRHRVAVLGHALWRQRFGGDPRIVDRTIRLDGNPYQVVGVMPAGFDFPGERELWTPLEYTAGFRDDANRAAHFLSLVGRRGEGVTTGQAAADVAAIAGRIRQAFPGLKDDIGGGAVSLREEMVGGLRAPLLVLLAAVGFVLLIACVNVANLMLARAMARESELAVRAALGAERGRLVRQLLTESVLLGLAGGAAGLLLGAWGTEWLVNLQPRGIPRLEEVGVDWRVAAFTAAVSLLTGLLFGLVPAYHVTRGDLAGSLKEGGRGALTGRGTQRVRASLVVVETALAVVLLAGAGLLIRSFVELRAVDPGFRTESALAVDLALPAAAYPDDDQVRGFYGGLAERVGALPGVNVVGAVSALPMSGIVQNVPFRVEGRPEPRPGDDATLEVRTVTPAYLPAMGVPVLRGRGFTDADREGARPVVLLSAAAAERHFPGEDPVGKRIELALTRGTATLGGEVVGIVGDVRNTGLAEDVYPSIYVAHAQFPLRRMSLVARTEADPRALEKAIARQVRELDPNLPLFNVRTLEEVVGESVSQPRFYMLLLSIFAAAALVLAALGIFGVMSFAVVQRTREIGIRMALGAAPASVVRQIVGGALRLTLVGLAVGLLGALAGTRLLSGLLFGVAPTDPATLGGVAVVLTGVALLASYLPARRATRVDPTVALRSD